MVLRDKGYTYQEFVCEFGGEGERRFGLKRMSKWEKNGRGGLWGLTFLHNIKLFSRGN